MSIHAMNAVFRGAEGVSGNDRVVLLVLADHANDDGSDAYPSQATIASKAGGLTDRCVRDCLRRLEAAGWVRREGRSGVGGTINYRVALDGPFAAEPPENGLDKRSENPSGRKASSDKPSLSSSSSTSSSSGTEQQQQQPLLREEKDGLAESGFRSEGIAAEWDDWLGDYREVTGRPARGATADRRAFTARRKEGYTLDDLKLATRGCHGDEFCRQNGHDVPATILRPSKVERYVLLGREGPKRRSLNGRIPRDRQKAAIDAWASDSEGTIEGEAVEQ